MATPAASQLANESIPEQPRNREARCRHTSFGSGTSERTRDRQRW
jgi:hypothetical protein